jgi:16S rRNA (guanine(966)-N(2))-methyltransferase RsmD
VRVIAGKYRSRRLKGPGTLRVRPTSDRLRETLFNVLGPTLEDSLFVDLYAGTGAVGIEALSRGAREAIFVEKHAGTARLLRENLDSLKIADKDVRVMQMDTLAGLKELATRKKMADFIFLDPPYEDEDEYATTLEFLDASHLISPQGLVIAEHDCKFELTDRLNRLERTRLLEQGDAALSFYRLAAAA